MRLQSTGDLQAVDIRHAEIDPQHPRQGILHMIQCGLPTQGRFGRIAEGS